MKKLYFVLTYTGTVLSKIIKIYTGERYSHISISLDKELEEMYSFGRINAYNAFIGGFVHENRHWGTFKRFKNTKAIIGYIEVSNEQYRDIKNIVTIFKEHKNEYKFNFMGLILVAFNKRFKREKGFYCAEFVKYLLDESNINNNLPSIIKPEDFLHMKNLKIIYEGNLKTYNCDELYLKYTG